MASDDEEDFKPAAATAASAAAAAEPSKSKKRKTPHNSTPNSSIPSLKPDELYVPWDRLASSRWGQDRLDRYISVPELDSLIGWATHITTSSQHYRQHAENARRSFNPLLGLSTANGNAPPRPSILKHLIQDPATRMIKAKQEYNDQMAVELGMALKRSTTTTMHAASNNPLWEGLDHSAAVALGIVAEEMLTALLLPLARRHVQHCRALEMALTRLERSSNAAPP
jgi:hypothetical protein